MSLFGHCLVTNLPNMDKRQINADRTRLQRRDSFTPFDLSQSNPFTLTAIGFIATLLLAAGLLRADDWPMMGRDKTRNPVSPEKGAPIEWDVKTGRNIKWRAPLGNNSHVGEPVVGNGLVWMGTINDPPSDPDNKESGPVLKCFNERDGAFIWQFVASPGNSSLPRAYFNFGFYSSPLIETGHVWLTTHYAQVFSFDLRPLHQGARVPRLEWVLEMHKSLDVWPFYSVMSGHKTCSIGATYRDRIYVITGNGITGWEKGDGRNFRQVKFPNAPSLVCLDKNSGKVLWQDNSPVTNIIFGQWGTPLVAEIGGRGQVVTPMGDGWLRSFDALTGELLWKLNINLASLKKRDFKNHFLNAPVLYQGHIFIGGGHDAEYGEGPGSLFCIDPTRRGDVSLELEDGPGKGKPNPNSALVWHMDSFGRTMSQVAVHEGLVIAAGYDGMVHCLDAQTGQRYWRHDMKAHVFASPLIVDGKVYVGQEDGEVHIFDLANEKRLLFTGGFEAPVQSSPIFANGVLYVATSEFLYAIKAGTSSPPPAK